MLAETWHNPDPGRNVDPDASPEPAPHPDVFDPEATLPSLRSGGLSLLRRRARRASCSTRSPQSKAFDDALESGGAKPRPFAAEDLVRGYRLDVWDSRTDAWHSLHLRDEHYAVKEVPFDSGEAEGFVQLAVTQPAQGASPATNDLYLHEAIARWAGWSLSVPLPGKPLGRAADPEGSPTADEQTNQPKTPFKLTTSTTSSTARCRACASASATASAHALSTSPETACASTSRSPTSSRRRSACRATATASRTCATSPSPRRSSSFAIRGRHRPGLGGGPPRHPHPQRRPTGTRPPQISPRPTATSSRRGRASSWPSGTACSTIPRGAREATQRPGSSSPIATLGNCRRAPSCVAGKKNDYAVVPADRIDALPYLPDPLSRGAALRDLPGAPPGALGEVDPAAAAAGAVAYSALPDPNPRPGSATIVPFTDDGDWTTRTAFRLQLDEPTDIVGHAPVWDPVARLLQMFLPKGTMTTRSTDELDSSGGPALARPVAVASRSS